MDPALDVKGEARERAGEAGDAVKQAADSREVGWLGRAGLAARGIIYLLLGVLALLLADGARREQVDQRGALAELGSKPAGNLLLVVLTCGLAAYSVWRFAEAIRGVKGEGGKDWPRVGAVLGGLSYAALTVTAVSVLAGSGQSQSAQQRGLTAFVMDYPGGRLLVGLVGVLIVATSAYLVYEGTSGRLTKSFRPLPPGRYAVIRLLGLIGSIGRGVVFGLVGVLVVWAAWTYAPTKAGGVDVALKTVLSQPYGRWLVAAAGLALLAFGFFGLAESRYRRT